MSVFRGNYTDTLMPDISLPNNWSPRAYQQPLWDALADGVKRAVCCWHRRSGKDDAMLHHNACSAFERVGNYWYMLPEYNQCRKAIWDAINPHTGRKRIDEAFPKEIRANVNNQEMKITFVNGSTWQLMGSDNYDSLVGSPPIGLTFSEYALSNPTSWGFLRPIMLENGGWAIFNSTPRGNNHFKSMFDMAANKPSWFSQILTVDDTGVFTPEQLEDELQELISEHGPTYGRALFQQEYYCSFDAAIPGAIWAEELIELQEQGRIQRLEIDPRYPVHTAWDLGSDDDTAIWFYQVIGEQINIVDCYSDNFSEPDEHAEMLFEKKYYYGSHWLPHDAKPKHYGMGAGTVIQQFEKLRQHYKQSKDFNLGRFDITPSFTRADGIKAARKTLHQCYFDKSAMKSRDGKVAPFECLKAYHRKYDDKIQKFSDEPVHDWSSHYADAFRYLSLTWKESKKEQIIISPHAQLLKGNVIGMTFGDITKQHFKRMRQRRERA